jgi:FKBP-type peptidyl-prolyl cis-trans isomerase SlyD
MKAEANKVVSITYELKKDSHQGELIEKVTQENAVEFIFGKGMMLPAFEKNLENLEEGTDFQFELKVEEAYGPVMKENVIDIPADTFAVDGKIQEGLLTVDNIITMQDNEGHQFPGRVDKVEGDKVTMDFNHPMAGQDLYFTGNIVGLREATKEELDHGHVHNGDHHHH